MATAREGDRTVLLVVDVQAGVVANAWDADRVVANVARAVDRARAAEAPVMWVRHEDDELAVGSPAWRWADGLVPAEGEPVVAKRFNSAFEATTLEAMLEGLGATHVVLAGAASNWCIRATAHGALDRGYDLTLIADAHTTEALEFQDGTRIDAATIVRELNAAMRWLSYPGRRNAAVGVDEVDFGVARGGP